MRARRYRSGIRPQLLLEDRQQFFGGSERGAGQSDGLRRAAEQLREYFARLRDRHIEVVVAKAHLPLRKTLSAVAHDMEGEHKHFGQVADAVAAFKNAKVRGEVAAGAALSAQLPSEAGPAAAGPGLAGPQPQNLGGFLVSG